jgi:hypothetical protein
MPAAERQQETETIGLRFLWLSCITGRIQANVWREGELTWAW